MTVATVTVYFVELPNKHIWRKPIFSFLRTFCLWSLTSLFNFFIFTLSVRAHCPLFGLLVILIPRQANTYHVLRQNRQTRNYRALPKRRTHPTPLGDNVLQGLERSAARRVVGPATTLRHGVEDQQRSHRCRWSWGTHHPRPPRLDTLVWLLLRPSEAAYTIHPGSTRRCLLASAEHRQTATQRVLLRSALSLLLLEEIKIISAELCAQVKPETQTRTGYGPCCGDAYAAPARRCAESGSKPARGCKSQAGRLTQRRKQRQHKTNHEGVLWQLLNFKHGTTPFAYGFFPTTRTLVQKIPYNFCQRADAGSLERPSGCCFVSKSKKSHFPERYHASSIHKSPK